MQRVLDLPVRSHNTQQFGRLWHKLECIDANFGLDLAVYLARGFDAAKGRETDKLVMLGKARWRE